MGTSEYGFTLSWGSHCALGMEGPSVNIKDHIKDEAGKLSEDRECPEQVLVHGLSSQPHAHRSDIQPLPYSKPCVSLPGL